jgi:hypothetical protein
MGPLRPLFLLCLGRSPSRSLARIKRGQSRCSSRPACLAPAASDPAADAADRRRSACGLPVGRGRRAILIEDPHRCPPGQCVCQRGLDRASGLFVFHRRASLLLETRP